MGVYVLDPRALQYVEPNQHLDLPELVTRMLEANAQVGAYIYDGYWLDIGRHEDYEKAILEFEQVKPLLMDEHSEDPPAGSRASRPSGHAPAVPPGHHPANPVVQ
jgi:ADP-glucose pyrophosphorylase